MSESIVRVVHRFTIARLRKTGETGVTLRLGNRSGQPLIIALVRARQVSFVGSL